MVREVKWTKYFWMSLLSFGAFMLEYLSIFVVAPANIIMVFMWAFFIGALLFFSRKQYHFPVTGNKRDIISLKIG